MAAIRRQRDAHRRVRAAAAALKALAPRETRLASLFQLQFDPDCYPLLVPCTVFSNMRKSEKLKRHSFIRRPSLEMSKPLQAIWTNFSSIGATSTLSHISSLRMRSRLV